ncbi:MAG TPA: ABC transporter ATP-binding protein, partial [Cyanobacteria bacterium UBA11049]|nr:ABC transporter ATP-binding protein [Cyanobacteria bacterium UBA11049]
PGQIQSEIIVDLPPNRDLDIKLSADFIQIKRQVIQALRGNN